MKLSFLAKDDLVSMELLILFLTKLSIGIGLKIISTSLADQNGIGIGLDFGFYKRIMKYNLGIVIKNLPASGMMWSNGYIEGTRPSAEFGLHRSFDVFDGNAT